MTHKKRTAKALSHEQPDKVPIDFGGTVVTGMHVSCVAALRDHYALGRRPVKVHEPYQMLGLIEDDLLDAMGVSVKGITARNTLFGFANENWKPLTTAWGQEVLVPEKFNVTQEPNGDLVIYPQGDTSVPPSGRMPQGGFYFDSIIRQEPIDERKLDPRDNLEEFGPLSDEDLKHFEMGVKQAAASERAVVVGFSGAAFGDIALVPAPFLKHPKGIRDVAEWYISTAVRRDYVHAIFSRQCEIALENLRKLHAVVGEAVDVLFTCGTDFGTQTSSFCSTDTYDSLYGPYYRKLNHWIHQNTTWKTFKHSCGAVEPFMPHFIDSGFDIINPVQCSAAGMDPRTLKDRYGDRLVFWGGGVDTQKTLPFATPGQVRSQVLQRCEIFAANGGFVFNAIHNVQPNTPVRNIAAMLDAVKEFNGEL